MFSRNSTDKLERLIFLLTIPSLNEHLDSLQTIQVLLPWIKEKLGENKFLQETNPLFSSQEWNVHMLVDTGSEDPHLFWFI
jgi:hypothetical protein